MSRNALLVLLLLAALAAAFWLLGGPAALFGGKGSGGDGPGDGAGPDLAAGPGEHGPESAEGPEAGGRRGPGLFGRPSAERRGEGALSGRLVRFSDQKAVEGAVVLVTGTDHGGTAVKAQATSDATGSFLFATLSAGEGYLLRVEARGEAPFTLPDVEVRAHASRDLGTLYLGALAALVGRVVDEAGRPVVGAEVRVYTGYGSFLDLIGNFFELFTTLDREPTPLAKGRSEAEGRFRIEGLAPGPLVLRATVPGKRAGIAKTRMTPEGPTGGPVVVTIEPGAVVAGVVVDDAGRPVAKATLALMGEGGMDPTPVLFGRVFVVTDEKGAFRAFVDEREKKVRAFVAAEGFPRTVSQAITPGREDVRIVLRAGVEVEVTVLEKDTRTPIAGAQVMLMASDSGKMGMSDPDASDLGGIFAGVTDAHGVVTFACRPGVLEMVMVSHPGHASVLASPNLGARMPSEPGTGSDGPLERELSAQKPNRLRFLMGRGVTLVGRVLDTQGAGIPNAEVRSMAFGMGMDSATTRSGADGAYRLEGVAVTGDNAMVFAKAPGWVSKGPMMPGVPIPKDATGEVKHDFTLEAASTVRGRVVDPEGKGIAGAEVRFESGGGFGFESLLLGGGRGVTGADGTYVLFDVAAGKVPSKDEGADPAMDAPTPFFPGGGVASGPHVKASMSGFVSGASKPFDVPEGGSVDAPTIRLSRGAVLRGRVTEPGGKPVPGATVEVSLGGEGSFEDMFGMDPEGTSRTLHTGADGAFELAAVPPGEATFTASAAGWASARATAKVEGEKGPESVEIRLRAARDVHGRVLGPDGNGIQGASVSVEGRAGDATGDDAYVEPAHATTAADGAFTLRSLPIGAHAIRVTAEGFRSATVTADAGGASLEVRLAARAPADPKRLQEVNKELGEIFQKMGSAKDKADREALQRRMMELVKEQQELQGGDGAMPMPAAPLPEEEIPAQPEEAPPGGMR